MSSGATDARAAIGTLFRAGWTAMGQSDAVIAWPNRPFAPPDGSWVRLTIRGVDAYPVELGPHGQERRTGVVIAQIFTALDKGDAAALALADGIRAIFVDAVGVAVGDRGTILFRKPRVLPVGVDAERAFWQVNVEVPFQHDAVP